MTDQGQDTLEIEAQDVQDITIADIVIEDPVEETPETTEQVFEDPKILILGHGRHGKDSAAEILRDEYGLRFTSSSMFACERVIFDHFNNDEDLPSYETPEECYADRSNFRSVWYDMISAFNTPDKTTLARQILEECDMYVGMRSVDEFDAARELFTHIIWIDASGRGVPLEPKDSFTIDCDKVGMTVIENNRSLNDLSRSIGLFARSIGLKPIKGA